jgi:hypothetical protein
MSAYPFCESHGLTAEVDAIKRTPIDWELSYNSTVRRGYLIVLMEKHQIFDEFLDSVWPHGRTEAGRREIESCVDVMERYEMQKLPAEPKMKPKGTF